MSVYLIRPFITTNPFYSQLSERTLTIDVLLDMSLSDILSDSLLSANVTWGEYDSQLGTIVSVKEMLVSGSWIPYDGSVVMVVGHVHQVREIVTDGVTTRVFTSASKTVVQRPLYPPVNTVAPRIAYGDTYYRIGHTLAYTSPGNTGTWSPAADSYEYRWLRNGSPIAGATSSTYLLVAADNNTTIVGQIRGTNGDGTSSWVSAVDNATGIVGKETRYLQAILTTPLSDQSYDYQTGNKTINVAGNFSNIAGGTWSISGHASVSINASTGLITILTTSVINHQNITVTYTNSGGATSDIFDLYVQHKAPTITGTISNQTFQQSGSSSTLSATPYFVDANYGSWSISGSSAVSINSSTGLITFDRSNLVSSTTITVTYTNGGGSVNQTFDFTVVLAIPVISVAPVISGTTHIGQTLSSSTGTWTGTVSSYSYQWRRNGSNIAGATSSTYVLQSADDTTTITCAVIATNSTGSSEASVSNGLSITYAPPIAGELNDVEYYIGSGDQTVDVSEEFTGAIGGSWSIEGPGTIDGSGIVTISTDDLRNHVAITVSYTNSGGSDSITFYLDVVPAPLYPPVNTVAPAMSGSFRIGGSDLGVSTGTWDPAADSYNYRWKRAGVVISGQTNNVYTPGPTDNNQVILAEVQGINADGASEWVAASGSATVLYLAPSASGSIPDQVFNIGSGNQTVNAAPAFSNAYGGSWSVSGGYSINSSGVVTITTDSLLVANITVTYTNSGGSATQTFQLTIINNEMLNIVDDYAVSWTGEPPSFNTRTDDGFIWGYEETIRITGTAPVLGASGSILSERVTWGSYLPNTGSITITRQAKKNYNAWVLYSTVSSETLTPGDTWQVRELYVHNDHNLSRTFTSNSITIAED